ncbi:STAS/SEC14 domain-containing protein [Natrinema amylolyticum]|uniref:STAS/SEC14 domain-containing protein n=1 Tax=Natrinema amylolyticum TaxID=2878679 RepID=UPI001CFBD627|nr:STAS/SEC14 domain-containing protein [Natrinema amylolyticum]
MFDVLKATADDVVAVRVGTCTTEGFRKLYDRLTETTVEYDTVHMYEEAPSWTLRTSLSNLRGIVPDLRQGPSFDIGRYAAVGDSRWAKLLFYQWRVITTVWPVAPDEMRFFELPDRARAFNWVKTGTNKRN